MIFFHQDNRAYSYSVATDIYGIFLLKLHLSVYLAQQPRHFLLALLGHESTRTPSMIM